MLGHRPHMGHRSVLSRFHWLNLFQNVVNFFNIVGSLNRQITTQISLVPIRLSSCDYGYAARFERRLSVGYSCSRICLLCNTQQFQHRKSLNQTDFGFWFDAPCHLRYSLNNRYIKGTSRHSIGRGPTAQRREERDNVCALSTSRIKAPYWAR